MTAHDSERIGLTAGPISAANGVICPACGGANPDDAVFCGHPGCHKALGEFKYVLEELLAARSRIERLADGVAQFAGKPPFIAVHAIWFGLWVLANGRVFGALPVFDEYPYSLLGLVLAVEAIFITGFVLISQNHQTAYSEKRAELDYEITIRSYRKLMELERRLETLKPAPSSEGKQTP
ncbi:DUF1003 domain-containing protein [Methylococcus sp. EFPC2]|uniref:DUF1003 domain-containing protein n=1 Tax=Methylococcus sp. EFPC2 TaxID=2812648 RepID=UPI001966D800|nr:DUF1003 domain-containing protein [Methylococcus sp. EFPC2]QSA95779.1 DUF1003 domain-containing protein [Methylococcus sp. EFPC2]